MQTKPLRTDQLGSAQRAEMELLLGDPTVETTAFYLPVWGRAGVSRDRVHTGSLKVVKVGCIELVGLYQTPETWWEWWRRQEP